MDEKQRQQGSHCLPVGQYLEPCGRVVHRTHPQQGGDARVHLDEVAEGQLALTGGLTGGLAGGLAGALTGGLAGALTGALTGGLTGSLTGALTGGLARGDVLAALL